MILVSLLAASLVALCFPSSAVRADDDNKSPLYPPYEETKMPFPWRIPGRLLEMRGHTYTLTINNYLFNQLAVLRSFYDSGTTGFSYTASGDLTTITSYATVADFSVPMKVPPTLFSGFQSDLNAGIVRIHQGRKRTSLKSWSEIQTLSPPEKFNSKSFYAQSIAADQRTRTVLAVGCPGCNATAEGGQVYLYTPNPGGSAWSQSQVLELSSTATHAGYHRLGRDIKLHDNILLTSVYVPHDIPKNGYIVYSRGSDPKDPFEPQQILATKFGNVTGAAVYEETIVLANSLAGSGAFTNVGEVHILYPSTPKFGLKPASKPRPIQWSVQQILRPPTRENDLLFGSCLAIDRNHLVVTSVGIENESFLFRREERSGQWSQQQVLLSSDTPIDASIAGSAIALSYPITTSRTKIFTNQANWDCLVLSLEDQFGDGWDTAELIVATPDGTHDYFTQACDTYNLLKLRYCPHQSDGGLYSFSIPEAVKAKHHWEILWGIFDEKTGIWYRGDWNTKMDFHWDPDSLSFSPRKIERPLANSTVCRGCPSRPTEKPTPLFHRSLKGDTTRSPTISPAPTLATTNSENWRYLTLYGDSHPWFDKQYRGTNYYLSDAHGRRLISTGTACTIGIDQKCWLDLPDGDYILRLGGALDLHKSSHTFSFCKTVNQKAIQSQMMFRIRDDDCSIVTYASKNAICNSYGYSSSVLSTLYLVLNVNILLYGTSVSTITSAEHSVFQTAMASIFKGLSPADITLVSMTPSGSNTFANANIRLSSAVSGYNFLDFDQESSFESFLKDSFTGQALASSLEVALSSGSIASALSRVTRVEFLDYQLVDNLEVETSTSPSSGDDFVTSYEDSSFQDGLSSSEPSTSVTPLLKSISLGGYLFAFVGFSIFIALISLKKTAAAAHPIAAPKTPKVLPKALSPNDLRELAQMESDYLNIVSSHGVPS